MKEASLLPLVTAGILSFNRKSVLRTTLSRLLADDYPRLEIILIDNASSDGTQEMVRTEFPAERFPQLRTMFLDDNIGIEARNILFREATGTYLFSFDDDSYPSTPQLVGELVGRMEADTDIAALCCSCIHPDTGYNETGRIDRFAMSGDPENGYDLLNVAAGGTMFRLSDVLQTRLYDASYFFGREELDLGFQIVQLGKRVMFFPRCVVYHEMSGENRAMYKRLTQYTRNTIWTVWKYFPLAVSLPLNLLYSFRRLLPVLKDAKRFVPVCKGIAAGTGGFFRMRKAARRFSIAQSMRLWRSMYKILYE